MTKIILYTFLWILPVSYTAAQAPATLNTWWRAQLHRQDGAAIAFNIEWKKEKGKDVWYIRNAEERIRVTDIRSDKDSLVVKMPVFESEFRLIRKNNRLEGTWLKAGAARWQSMPFSAVPGKDRFPVNSGARENLTGRWAASFTNSQQLSTPSVAEFKQAGQQITGTFLTPTGDYRYLEGVVTGDSLLLSGFDGSHAFLFIAQIKDGGLSGGQFFSGASSRQTWTARKDAKASLRPDDAAMYLLPGEEKLHFTFNDLQGKPVSINDDQYKNKVVIIQLMGSWCPNCMDETAFLSAFYNKNKQRGIEVIALAYEYTTDTARSAASLRKFKNRFNVQYTILNTGVTVSDTLRTQKTLPQLSPIKMFPSSVILDKQGRVRKLDTGFNGPATGTHYTNYVREFNQTIDRLLSEKIYLLLNDE